MNCKKKTLSYLSCIFIYFMILYQYIKFLTSINKYKMKEGVT